MHLGGLRWRRGRRGRRRRRRLLVFGFSVVVLKSVREQRRLLVELFATHFALERSLAAQRVHLHVVVQAGLLVGGEVTVGALVLLPGQNVLVMILCVAFEETSRLEFLPTKHAWVDSQRLTVRTDDDGCGRQTQHTFIYLTSGYD